MASNWEVQLYYGDIKTQVRLTHQYPDGRHEPWVHIAYDKNAVGKSGHWSHNQRGFGAMIRWFTPENDRLLELYDFQELKRGKLGKGIFLLEKDEGYSFKFGIEFFWELLYIDGKAYP